MDFVILANAWSAAFDNPTSKHQIALELVRQGHRVLWVEGAGMRTPSLTSGLDRRRVFRRLLSACRGAVRAGIRNQESGVPPSPGLRRAGRCPSFAKASAGKQVSLLRQSFGGQTGFSSDAIWVLSPLTIPLPSSAWARRFNGWLVARLARKWGKRLGLRSPVLINYVPVFAEVMRRWTGYKVYHCVDRWDAFGTYDAGLMTDMDRTCCESADLVVASSRDLFERCRRHNANTHLVQHGVDHAHFAKALRERTTPRNAGRAEDRTRTIGFFGLISEWVDQSLLVRLAREIPQARVVLIGKADVPTERLTAETSIRLLGPKSYEELPACVADFDVGIIPFVVNDLTRAVNPIKLREMLAAGCPVVSTALPEVEEYQRSEVRSQRSEESGERRAEGGERRAGKQGSGVRGQGSEVRSQESEACPASHGVREQRPEDRQPATNNSATQQPDNYTPKAVAVAPDADAFVGLVRKRLANPLSATERQRISDSVKDEDWKKKVDEILALIAGSKT